MTNIPIGTSHSEKVVVDNTNVASTIGSGEVEFFATPMMVALAELAASRCVAGFLDEGLVTVGTHIDLDHTSATPVGLTVTAIVTVTAVDQKRVEFAVVVNDPAGEVGRGRHTRFIVDKAKLTEKANQKKRAH